MMLLLNASLILCRIIVKTSAMYLEDRKSYCLSLKKLVSVEVVRNFFVDNNLKNFQDDTKKADAVIL